MPVFRLFHHRLDDTSNAAQGCAIADAMIRGDVAAAITLGLYEEAARIEAPSIHEVFRLSNSIDHHWSENVGVLISLPRCRSTMIGDLVLDVEGRLMACVTVGWQEQGADLRDAFVVDIGTRVREL